MNRLQEEKSPYLLQHQNNPVDWFPWGEEAFAMARQENKPIFLSIGYSTCHWCHVMEKESFESEATAAVMNKYFINIKVDREERPDVDKVYMSAVQTMVGQGGWPLSVFLTPDLKPFYGGTYFPPHDGYGRPGFPSLLERVHEVWEKEREQVIHSSEELTKQLQHRHPVNGANTEIDETILKRTYHQIAAGYDPKFSGFGSGTKFPRPAQFNFLFRYYYRTKEKEALSMSLTTLMAMASGGMVDHLGGGFHRYSVDPQWRVPHFEKMLYDQAQLIHSYLDAYQTTHDAYFSGVAEDTLGYVLRDLTSPEGGFYSAEDADSSDPDRGNEKVEGAFYVWKKSEIDSLLTQGESRVFCHHYSVAEEGNALSDPHQEFTGKNILFNPFTIEQTAQHLSITPQHAAQLLASGRQSLLAHRNKRTRPLRDDKVITSWNGLMIGACARAAGVLGNDSYADAAVKAASFIRTTLFDADSRVLFRRYRDGEVKHEAHLDDYAFLIGGLIELYRTTFNIEWLNWAETLVGTTITLFWDSAEGGFFDTSGKDSSILVRTKEAYDGAEPTGNSVMAMNLLTLYHYTNDPALKNYGTMTMKYFAALLEQSPQIMPHLMAAVEYYLHPPEHVVLAADQRNEINELTAVIHSMYRPHLNCILLESESGEYFRKRFPFMNEMKTAGGQAAAYVCRNYACSLPVNNGKDLRQLLESP